MRRMLCVALLTAFALGEAGCVVALGNKTPISVKSPRQQVVAVEGEIYVVNVHDGSVWKVDRETLESAKPLGATQEVEAEVEVSD
jgi:hypothetical protein